MKIQLIIICAFLLASCSIFPSEKRIEKISSEVTLPQNAKNDKALIYVLTPSQFAGFTNQRCFSLIQYDSTKKKRCNIARSYFYFFIEPGKYIAKTEVKHLKDSITFEAEKGKIYFLMQNLETKWLKDATRISQIDEKKAKYIIWQAHLPPK